MTAACSSGSWNGSKCRGFSIVTAIFLLVVLAALGAAIVIVSTTQQVSSALDVQGARIYQAARAGIEWGAYKKLRVPGYCAASTSTSFTFPTAPTLAGVTVTVTCTPHPDATWGGPTVYEIESTACNQAACPGAPSLTYVERRIRVTI